MTDLQEVAAVPPTRPLGVKRTFNLRGLGKYGAIPIIVITVFSVVDTFGNAAGNLLLNEVQREFKINLGYIVRISINIGAVASVLAVYFGYLADRSNRIRLLTIGVFLTGIAYVLTAASQSKGQYVGAQLFTALTVILNPVISSLIADWYPLERRGRVFSFYFMGSAVGELIAPIAVGAASLTFGWRSPFIFLAAIPTLLLVPFTLLLKNPIRGYWERKASMADEETAQTEDAPPSPGEAFRTYWSTRTLRRLSYAQPFARTRSAQGAALLLFYIVVHGLDTFRLGLLSSLYAAFSIIGLYIGGRILDRLSQVSPGKMMMLSGLGSLVNALSVLVIVFAPQLWIVIVFNCLLGLVLSVPDAAEQAVISSVIPPRVRGLGLAAFGLWSIGGLFLILATQAVAGDVGIRGAVLMFVPMQAIAAIIRMSAASFVEFDLRAARAKAMATADWAEAKRQGRDKLLVCRDVDVHYGSVQVLFGVDFEVEEGEIVALLGTNGAGKSTLLRAISGVTEATTGAILFDGDDITHIPPHEIAGKGVAQTPGGRGVFPGLTVKENLELAGWLHHDMEVRLEEVFEHFPVLRERVDEIAANLSGGQQQMLTLAQAFLTRPKLMMIDELSLGLSPAVVGQLLDMLRVIHAAGTTIILVEQSVNVALSIAQRAVFMEKGEVRFSGPTEELLDRPDILRSVFLRGTAGGGGGRGRIASPLTASAERDRALLAERPVVLEAIGLSKRYGGVQAVDDVDLELREGEVLGLIGPNGAGKSTVLGLLSGFIPLDGGRVVFETRDVTDMPPDERARLGLVRRFQDAELFPALTVAETLAVALERSIEVKSPMAQALRLPSARLAENRVARRVQTLVELFELGAFRDKFVGELSTGTRRVLDLACVLAVEPRVLLLDEPSSGLAQRETEAMGPLIRRIRYETGATIAIVEHDMPLISSVSDELLAMDLGRVVMRGAPDDVLSDSRVVESYLGSSEAAIARSGRAR